MIKKNCVILAIFASILLHSAVNAQWTSQSVPNDIGMLLDIDFLNETNGVAAGWFMDTDFRGRAIFTSDGGKIWQYAMLPDSTRAITGIQMMSSQTGYASAAYNFKFYAPGAAQAGSKPQKLLMESLPKNSLLMKGILNASASGSSHAAIGETYKGLFLKTTDGGQSFQTYGSLPEDIEYLTGISFTDEQTGYVSAVGSEATFGRILKTTDGGMSWQEQSFNDSLLYMKSTKFLDRDHGIAYGYSGMTDGGRYGVMFYTSDGGTVWKRTELRNAAEIVDVCFSNMSTGYAVGITGDVANTRSFIYKTSDGGKSWAETAFRPNQFLMLNGIHFVPGTGIGVVYGINQTANGSYKALISRTNNGGSSWTDQSIPDSLAGFSLTAGETVTDTSWYIAGGDWTHAVMLHLSESGTSVVSVNKEKEDKSFGLYQNYPNPFNPSTVIRYRIAGEAHVSLKIFDALGHEIKSLVNGVETAGNHEVVFNSSEGAALSSGTYFCRIEVRDLSVAGKGSFTEIKKLTLIK